MTIQESKISVSLIIRGERKYHPNFRDAFNMPEDVRALWNIYCDAKEDPLYYIAPNDMTKDQKQEYKSRKWPNTEFGLLSTWSFQ